ncbi:MAG: sugar-binding protein, partial [Verrucomicrobiota bacterium]
WDDDSVEIYIDANHSRSTTYDSTDFQIMKRYNDSGIRVYVSGGTSASSGVLHGWSPIADGSGYTVELAIPWTKLGVVPSDYLALGIDVGINADVEWDRR